jgi:endonuclease YncB( thermonuclease family)
VIRFLSIFSILAALALGNTAFAKLIHGRVVGVSDGDSVTVMDAQKTQHKIRLAGIDAPEKAQAYGQKAKASLSDLVYGQSVDVAWSKQDRYGRIVGMIKLAGVDINLEQIKRGMAWHYKTYQNEQSPEDRVAYAQSEREARDKRTGLWRDPAPIEPAVFRQKKIAFHTIH